MKDVDEVLQALAEPLDRARIRGVQVGGGAEAPYLPAFDIIQTANRIFGEDGWSYRVVGEPSFIANPGLWYVSVEVTALGVTRADVGTNPLANRQGQPANAGHFEMSIKGAVSDGLKRALRTFGDQFGNSLYDKDAEAEALRQDQQQQRGSQERNEPTPPQGRGAGPGELKDVGALLTWAKDTHKMGRTEVLSILGHRDPKEITDLAGAQRRLTEVANQAPA